jgi:hypothetical protein
MLIHTTKKLANELKIAPPEPPEQFDEMLSWRANYVREGGASFVVFVNDATRFLVCINEIKARDFQKLSELFLEVLRDEMRSYSINQDVISKYIAELGEFEYVRNANRQKTAWLNKAAEGVWYSFNHCRESAAVSQRASAYPVGAPKGQQRMAHPDRDFMAALSKRYGLPIRKGTAFDLTVMLDLDNRKAVRKLRVSANITFRQLHEVLQKAFGWHDCHLHSFGMFDKWSKNDYAEPEIELVLNVAEEREYKNYVVGEKGVKLSEYIPKYRKILYTYDYGDDWHHYIEVDAIVDGCEEELPILLSGEGDAPPEDVGGASGFDDFLRVIADPNDDEYEHLTVWSKSQMWQRFNFEECAWSVKKSLYW